MCKHGISCRIRDRRALRRDQQSQPTGWAFSVLEDQFTAWTMTSQLSQALVPNPGAVDMGQAAHTCLSQFLQPARISPSSKLPKSLRSLPLMCHLPHISCPFCGLFLCKSSLGSQLDCKALKGQTLPFTPWYCTWYLEQWLRRIRKGRSPLKIILLFGR